jgi:hypothetical protein
MREQQLFNGERMESVIETEVLEIAPEGLGFGEGNISLQSRHHEIGHEGLQTIKEALQSNDVIVPVSKDNFGSLVDDDGCGDGRKVSRIFEGDQERKKSLSRPKVFGGGATMAVATLIGLDKTDGKDLRQVFSDGIAHLHGNTIGFGAHTDTHAKGENCGCGAIDKAPTIIKNAVRFKDSIRASIGALGVSTEGLDEVEEAYENYAEIMNTDTYSGADVMSEIIGSGKVVKELEDEHKEVVIVLNMVEDHTLNQSVVRDISGHKAQAFAVDVWRVKQLADRLYASESDGQRHKAFLSQLVYTLSTAGTLTKGDLPVIAIQNQQMLAVA